MGMSVKVLVNSYRGNWLLSVTYLLIKNNIRKSKTKSVQKIYDKSEINPENAALHCILCVDLLDFIWIVHRSECARESIA